MVVVFVGLLILFSVSFWRADTYIITMTRLPIFFVGMYVGKLAWNEVYISKVYLAIMWIFVGLGIYLYFYWGQKDPVELWGKGYYWYPFILITPGLCVLLSILIELLKDNLGKVGEYVEGVFRILGECSFEIYLIHIWFFDILVAVCGKYEIWEIENRYWMLIIVAIIPAVLMLHYTTKGVIKIRNWIIKER